MWNTTGGCLKITTEAVVKRIEKTGDSGPTMQVEEWLACELVPVVGGHLVLDVVLLDVVEMLNAG